MPLSQHRPKFSIVLATYNASGKLEGALDSILCQDCRDFEILVADGGSSDGTVDILKSRSSEIAWWESAPDSGIFDAWNRCISRAKGEWIYFMGADDRLASSDTLTRASSGLRPLSGECLLAYGTVAMVGADGITEIGGPWDAVAFRSVRMTVPHQGTFHRAQLFERYGHFDTSDRYTSTYELMLRYLKDNDAVFVPGLLVAVSDDDGVSGKAKNQLRFYRAYIRAQLAHRTFRPRPQLVLRVLYAAAVGLVSATIGERHAHSLMRKRSSVSRFKGR